MDFTKEVISTALQTSESAMAQLQLSAGKFAYFVGKKKAATAQVVPLCPHYASLQDETAMESGTQIQQWRNTNCGS